MISGMRVRRRSSANGAKGFKFYRLRDTRSGSRNLRIEEFRLVTPENPSGVPSGGTATASHVDDATHFPAMRAFDDDVTTFWLSGSTDSELWLQYEFPEAVRVIEYRLYSNISAPSFRPSEWALEASNDGVGWTVLHTRVGEAIPMGTWFNVPL